MSPTMKAMGTLKVRVIWDNDGGRMVVVRAPISWMPHRPERMQVNIVYRQTVGNTKPGLATIQNTGKVTGKAL